MQCLGCCGLPFNQLPAKAFTRHADSNR
uniref:Uncharacterized protein n=1 Tax=Anguilla anguilla TaxID=7936 RepID=A0A0E9USF9_ANGAN